MIRRAINFIDTRPMLAMLAGMVVAFVIELTIRGMQ